MYCLTVKMKFDSLEGVPSKGAGFSILMVCCTKMEVGAAGGAGTVVVACWVAWAVVAWTYACRLETCVVRLVALSITSCSTRFTWSKSAFCTALFLSDCKSTSDKVLSLAM